VNQACLTVYNYSASQVASSQIAHKRDENSL